MFKLTRSFNATYAVIAAAVIAGVFTAASASGTSFATSTAAPTVQAAAAKSCAGEPWPYNHCSGAQSGDQSTVRVIRIN